jgi:hypothetical protein
MHKDDAYFPRCNRDLLVWIYESAGRRKTGLIREAVEEVGKEKAEKVIDAITRDLGFAPI